jgi:hypothetical protein
MLFGRNLSLRLKSPLLDSHLRAALQTLASRIWRIGIAKYETFHCMAWP